MNPVLVGRKSLRAPARRRESGAITAAVSMLTVALLAAGVAQSRAPESRPLTTPSLQIVAGSATLGTSLVLAPPESFGFRPATDSGGTYVLRLLKSQPPISVARSQALFAFYLDGMSRSGWTLQAEGAPSLEGDWTLRWQHATTAALISFYTSPRVTLEVTLCPPNPYC